VFDLRYHVASLAAVFLALIIGILVGVGIASETSVSTSDRRVFEQRIADLQNERDASRSEVDLLQRQQRAGTAYIDETYPVVMSGRLRGVRVALLFIGPVNGDLRTALGNTLTDADGPQITRQRALQLPIDPRAILDALPPDVGRPTLEDVGRSLAQELVAGGETPYWDALETVIVQDFQGASNPEVDAVVVAQTAPITDGPTGRFVKGLYAGLASRGVPAVGIARTDLQPQRIAVYRARGLSSVDAVDTQMGRVALAVLLAGGEEGHYGLNANADAVLPPIEPLPLAPPPGG
jgi:Copper transport outer membrane protein, MctB